MRLVVDLELAGELLRRRLVFLLLAVVRRRESQLDLGLILGPVGDQGFQVVQRGGLDLDSGDSGMVRILVVVGVWSVRSAARRR